MTVPSIVRPLFLIGLILSGIWVLAYADLVLRARGAYLEGEKYMSWARDPSIKSAYFNARLEEEKARLDVDKASGRISEKEYQARLKLARVEHDDALKESSLKYAYDWFVTAVRLCSPPNSRWVRMSREKMAEAKTLWKRELEAQKIPYQDGMLE